MAIVATEAGVRLACLLFGLLVVLPHRLPPLCQGPHHV